MARDAGRRGLVVAVLAILAVFAVLDLLRHDSFLRSLAGTDDRNQVERMIRGARDALPRSGPR